VESAAAAREWGDKIARRYIERVNVLEAAKSVDDLYKIPPLRFHRSRGSAGGNTRSR
jgi:proteic killer suppression protein